MIPMNATSSASRWNIRNLIAINLFFTMLFIVVMYLYIDILHSNTSLPLGKKVVNNYQQPPLAVSNKTLSLPDNNNYEMPVTNDKTVVEKQDNHKDVVNSRPTKHIEDIKTSNPSKPVVYSNTKQVSNSTTKQQSPEKKKTIFSTRQGPRQYFYEDDPHVMEFNGSLARHYLFDRPITSPLIIVFYADWCPHCRQYAPEYKQAAAKIHNVLAAKQAHYNNLFQHKLNPRNDLEKTNSTMTNRLITDSSFWVNPSSTAPMHIPNILFGAINCAKYVDFCRDKLFMLSGYPRMLMFHFHRILHGMVRNRRAAQANGETPTEQLVAMDKVIKQLGTHPSLNESVFLDMETVVRTSIHPWVKAQYLQYFPE